MQMRCVTLFKLRGPVGLDNSVARLLKGAFASAPEMFVLSNWQGYRPYWAGR